MIRKDQVQFCQTLERVGGKIVEFKKDWSFYEVHNPKTIICEAQAIEANLRELRIRRAVQAKKSIR